MNRMILSADAAMRHACRGKADGAAARRARGKAKRDASRLLAAAALALVTAIPRPALACATCGCSLSTDAAMGYSDIPGWRASLEFDFINQDQLRSGTSSISNAQVAAINDAGGSQEVEKQTINRYITAGLSYRPNGDWNFNLLVPYIDRSHTTYGAAMNPLTPDKVSGASVDSLGDIRFIASYQGFLPTHNLGLWRPQCRWHRHRRAQPRRIQYRAQLAESVSRQSPRHQPASGRRRDRPHCRCVLLPGGEPEFRRLYQRPISSRVVAQARPAR
jgi:hypothetical protein